MHPKCAKSCKLFLLMIILLKFSFYSLGCMTSKIVYLWPIRKYLISHAVLSLLICDKWALTCFMFKSCVIIVPECGKIWIWWSTTSDSSKQATSPFLFLSSFHLFAASSSSSQYIVISSSLIQISSFSILIMVGPWPWVKDFPTYIPFWFSPISVRALPIPGTSLVEF